MYGHAGGRKEGRKYPTVQNVRDKFYEIHKDAVIDADPTGGEIPNVQHSTFRYTVYIRLFIVLSMILCHNF